MIPFDVEQFARDHLIEGESYCCRACGRDYGGHELKCGAALHFGLPRRAYPDHDAPIGPETKEVTERRAAQRLAMEKIRADQVAIWKAAYPDHVESLVYDQNPLAAWLPPDAPV